MSELILLFGVVKRDVVIARNTSDEDFVSSGIDGENHVDVAELIAGIDATNEDVERVLGEVEGFLRLEGGRVSGSDFVDEGIGVAKIVKGDEANDDDCDLNDDGEENGEGFLVEAVGMAGFRGFVGFVDFVGGEKEVADDECDRYRKESQNGGGDWDKVTEGEEIEGEQSG